MLRLDHIFLLLMVSSVFLTSLPAYAERGPTEAHCPRVPKIELQQALELASDHMKEKGLLNELYIDTAALKCKNDTLVWEIGWRRKKYESGHWILQIHPDKSIRGIIIKDG